MHAIHVLKALDQGGNGYPCHGTTTGVRDVQTFGAVKLTVQGRDCVCDVAEVDEACPVLIGQVPLELMDFVIDPGGRTLTGNPAHGGEHIIELL